jgi:signal transduction histidine kinase
MSFPKQHILIVDDTQENLRLLSGILKGKGYGVRVAPNGYLALQSARINPPDLILLDIMMPGMDGYAVCETLKAEEPTRDIPIIFISALHEVFDKIKAFSVGGVDYITKPFEVQEVLARVTTHLALQQLQNQLQAQNETLRQEISERKRAEEALDEERTMLAQRVRERTEALSIANAELERAARLKDEFLASMSHELRTPLNAILGMSEALEEQIHATLTDQQKETLAMITQSGHRLLKVINDILEFSRIEAGKITLTIAPCLVNTLCQASLRAIQQQANGKHIETSLEIDDDVTEVQLDEQRLKQSLVKLLENAIKFTAENGSIGIKVTGDSAQEVLRFTIWDTGAGIGPEEMPRLFKPFVQGEGGLSRTYGGIGLSLMLVYRFITMHGGSITVESEARQGSRFTLALPWNEHSGDTRQTAALATQTEVEDSPSQAALADEHNPLILLIEDHEPGIKQFSDHLTSECYRVIVARNSVEALERSKEDPPSAILLDVQLHDMEATELIRLLHKKSELAHVPIIGISSLVRPGDREQCLAAGASDYLVKPVCKAILLQSLKEAATA